MEHRDSFTSEEILKIKALLIEKEETADKNKKKSLRNSLRKMGFYISDYHKSGKSYTVENLNESIDLKKIKIK